MTKSGRRNPILLFVGDIIAFAVSLYVTLLLRYGSFPSAQTLAPYWVPFSILFGVWALVFYSAGLYGKRIALFPSHLPDALLKTQLVNILGTALFFFLVPSFGIAPKTILVLYLVVSLALVALWRLGIYPYVSIRRLREQAALVASGEEADELFSEVNGNPRYDIIFHSRDLHDEQVSILVVDKAAAEEIAKRLSAYADKQIIAFEDFYEEVFDRIPLSQLEQAWFRDNTVSADSFGYAISKRVVDFIGGVAMLLVTVVLVPFIWIANLFEGGGPLFIVQERFGRYGVQVMTYKFRSMTQSDTGAWKGESKNVVTKVGAFLRKTSLDEFPQAISIIRGELSLIGPRSDIRGLGERLAEALPYYMERYLVVPGITGWAQINQQYEQGNVSPQSIAETRVRLSYDFYYLKHRSFALDIIIALKTVKRMFFRVSSW